MKKGVPSGITLAAAIRLSVVSVVVRVESWVIVASLSPREASERAPTRFDIPCAPCARAPTNGASKNLVAGARAQGVSNRPRRGQRRVAKRARHGVGAPVADDPRD